MIRGTPDNQLNMEIHLLYDSRPQPDKLPLVLDEINKQHLWLEKIWEPVPAKSVVESINLSFKRIVKYAKEKGLHEVCIMEDDLQFTCQGAWDYFLINMPLEFDIWVGGNYLLNDPDKYTAPRYKLDEYVGNQLIVINEKYYDRFLEVKDIAHIDTIQKGRGDFYACWPMVALQRPGFSANAMMQVNYNSSLKPEWIYNGAVYNV